MHITLTVSLPANAVATPTSGLIDMNPLGLIEPNGRIIGQVNNTTEERFKEEKEPSQLRRLLQIPIPILVSKPNPYIFERNKRILRCLRTRKNTLEPFKYNSRSRPKILMRS